MNELHVIGLAEGVFVRPFLKDEALTVHGHISFDFALYWLRQQYLVIRGLDQGALVERLFRVSVVVVSE